MAEFGPPRSLYRLPYLRAEHPNVLGRSVNTVDPKPLNTVVQQCSSVTTEMFACTEQPRPPGTQRGGVTTSGHCASFGNDGGLRLCGRFLHCSNVFALCPYRRGLHQQRVDSVGDRPETRLREHGSIANLPTGSCQPCRDRMNGVFHRTRNTLGDDLDIGVDHFAPPAMHIDLVDHQHNRCRLEGRTPALDIGTADRSRRVDDDHDHRGLLDRVGEPDLRAVAPGEQMAYLGLAGCCGAGEGDVGG